MRPRLSDLAGFFSAQWDTIGGMKEPLTVLALLAIVIGYPAAYLSLLERPQYWKERGEREARSHAEYRIGGPYSEILFAPANIVDRFVRPVHWK